MKDTSRTQAKEKIDEFFKNIEGKSPEQIAKMKRVAMHHHIRLGEKRKMFCKFCFSTKLKVRKIIKNIKTVECLSCGKLMRWGLNS